MGEGGASGDEREWERDEPVGMITSGRSTRRETTSGRGRASKRQMCGMKLMAVWLQPDFPGTCPKAGVTPIREHTHKAQHEWAGN